MSEQAQLTVKAQLMIALWFLSTLALIALFISAGLQGELTLGHILLAFTILTLAIAGTPFISRLRVTDTQHEKMKRQSIDSVLRGMNNEELIALRERLSDGEFREGTVEDSLDDRQEVLRK